MRIESVSAIAFGPLAGESLEFAPGFTVIVGANESAKSSWHAAIYAALCGRRRGKGASTLTDRRFADLHRPWDRNDWAVSARVLLDDGRQIEVTQDLAQKVDSRATELALARDVSDEIMHEGSIDASRWLGLDRTSFLATACINQASLLKVLEEAGGLQDFLGRAAASATIETTAASALELIQNYQRENVGRDISSAVKPLRKAKEALEKAESARIVAVREHDEYLLLVEDAQSLRNATEGSRARFELEQIHSATAERLVSESRNLVELRAESARADAKAIDAKTELDSINQRHVRISQLRENVGVLPPISRSTTDETTLTVTSALAAWKAAPEAAALEGENSEELRRRLDALPEAPIGDTQRHATVDRAHTDYIRAIDNMSANERRRTSPPEALSRELASAMESTPASLRQLAQEILQVESQTVFGDQELAHLAEDAARLRGIATSAHARPRTTVSLTQTASRNKLAVPTLFAGLALTLVSVGALALGAAIAGLATGVLALLAFAIATSTFLTKGTPSRTDDSSKSSEEEWQRATEAERVAIAAEERHRSALSANARAESTASDVHGECSIRRLPFDSNRVRELAAQVEKTRAQLQAAADWAHEQELAATAAAVAESRLLDSLRVRGLEIPDDSGQNVEFYFREYEDSCFLRDEQARLAAQREVLEQRLQTRMLAEADTQRSSQLREEAARAVLTAADQAGLGRISDEALPAATVAANTIPDLQNWMQSRATETESVERAQAEWTELETMLAGVTFEQFESTRSTAQEELEALAHKATHLRLKLGQKLAEVEDLARAENAGLVDGSELEGAESHLQEVRNRLEAARLDLGDSSEAASRAEAVRQERSVRVRSLAECEDVIESAQSELSRVNELSATLETTMRFLQQAQDRVHRNIAPILMATLKEWLPSVTGGRYDDAIVDPASLQVQIRGGGGQWRTADRLSVGTAEQVYLLLRMALAQHLTTTNEACPLILDDVTVQADEIRTFQILELLKKVSSSRQVILFAQESFVASWARENLNGSSDKVIQLQQVNSA
ncbi:MAG: AAA family ATPase [Actinomycetota bacterium]|nr:AAA family ATPase [Actinomycetota bacterium]